jgi:hypothetical protein
VVIRAVSPKRLEDHTFEANIDTAMARRGQALDMRPDIVVLVTGDSDFEHDALDGNVPAQPVPA